MTNEQKIQKVENLNKEAFSELVSSLLIKMGYITPINVSFGIIASLKGPMTLDQHGFIFFDNPLSGGVDITDISNKINEAKKQEQFSTIFITSPFHISKGFQDSIKASISELVFNFLDRDQLVKLIDDYLPDFWKHDDLELIDYEHDYRASILQESELKSLKIFSEKYQKLLNIFIEPKIIHWYEDKETQVPKKKSINLDQILKEKKPIILSGDAGMGKSTILKKIGETIILNNENSERKNLPVFVTVTELFDNKYSLKEVLEKKILRFFNGEALEFILQEYNVILLIDSLDELEIEHQTSIIDQLNKFYKDYSTKFILATRSSEKSVSIKSLKDYDTYNIARFSNQQIEQFIHKFFFNQENRAEKLLEALRENRIIEKLPITPLSLSLISILYEENDLEIPATITDIYDNFNSLLLGKAMVTSRIEFIDISFKERILSLYALELLKRKEHNPMTYNEFIDYFKEYFKSKTLPLKKGTLEEALDYLVKNTGIIYLKNNTYIAFNHDSFMEYYAAIEIFKHQRSSEKLYVNDFFDVNWQNSAVFYAGHSKDMPELLKQINDKLKQANHLNDYFSAINGAGYLLQALYQTDNELRKETIDIALEVNIRALELFVKLSSDEQMMFKSFKLPIIWLMNLIFFYENFNSVTLKEPLKLSFEQILKNYLTDSKITTEGYKALILALTLNSNRINEKGELENLVFKTPLLNDSVLTIISDISLEIMTNGTIQEVKKEVKKEFNKLKEPVKYLLKTPAGKLRFSSYDQISSSKKIKIVTEGKTDAVIIEHAYMTLMAGEVPYWKIKPAGNSDTGGSHEVNKVLIASNSTLMPDEVVIGIFDHDEAGINDFNRLPENVFETFKEGVIRKHKTANVYAILLPIPENKDCYRMKESKFNYFEIEHYFPNDFLSENDVLQDTPLTTSHNIYSIKSGKKTSFSNVVVKKSDTALFADFVTLLEEIDTIVGIEVNYSN